MKKIFIMSLMVLCSQFATAGGQVGKITDLNVRSDGLHWVGLEGVHGSKPSCAVQGYWMVKDENSVAGKTQISMLLAAYAAGKAVTIEGANTCTRYGDGEDIKVVTVK